MGTVWFQSLLPECIRNQTNTDSARIWTFGYPADVTFQAASIFEQAVALLTRISDVRKGYEVQPPPGSVPLQNIDSLVVEPQDHLGLPLSRRHSGQTRKSLGVDDTGTRSAGQLTILDRHW